MIYSIFLLIPFICEILSEKYEKNSKFFRYIGLSIVLLITSFRKGIGADLNTYYNFYKNVLDIGFGTMDFGYTLINYILRYLGFSFNFFLFITVLFYLLSYYRLIDKYVKEGKYIAVLIFFGVFDIFIYSLSAIRQSLSLAFIFFAYIAYEDRKNIKFILYIVLAYSMHWSVILWLPAFFIFQIIKKINISTLIIIVIFIPIIYKYLIETDFINLLSSINYNTEYYLITLGFNENNITGYILWTVICISWILVLTYFKKFSSKGILILKKIKLNDVIELSIIDWSLIVFFILQCCLNLQYNSAVPRLQMFFYFLLPITFTTRFYYLIKGSFRIILTMGLSILIFTNFFVTLSEVKQYYGMPSLTIYSND